MILGAQLYTLRAFTKNLEDFEQTLKKVADMGYTSIHLSGVSCEYTPEWIAEKCNKYGLKIALTHVPFERIVNETDKVIEEHKLMDCEYVGLGCFPNFYEMSEEDLKGYLAALRPALEKLKAAGLGFMYHNHHVEFGRREKGHPILMDLILDAMPAELFGLTLDMFWVQAGGADPVKFLREHADRARILHLKDMIFDIPERKAHYAPVGEGNMNYEDIVTAAKEVGVLYGFVELDGTYGEDPFVCLKKSYDYLASLGLK